ncbi:hypothetical protein T552_02780 [Pneumocystis carinii B80]|uniref:UTP--glucose-1-phosphate uridylyltransferase n=1 Tax=Pneumocystis carinii (strain B80) TaxID=1408658 RepID=A0A0W4ZEH2_PNEC8|nr:hypothetical protein T552_02780 [Pneumocystis carinii B80]KTW26779.1 hypothetical protein T552_02780 [Pneumocystis carinii B80]
MEDVQFYNTSVLGKYKELAHKRILSMEFEETSINISSSSMRNELDKLLATVKDEERQKFFKMEMDNFFSLFNRYLQNKMKKKTLQWDRIKIPNNEQVLEYKSIKEADINSARMLLDKLVVLKLNGGLGTTMGCVGPKSIIEVREGHTFLDLSVRQVEYLNEKYNVNVPLVLMNSFNTDEDTSRIIKKYTGLNVDIITFNQSRYPRISKESLLPIPRTYDSYIYEWYPPGHGDLFKALSNSGLLEKLLSRGKEILFVSNIDNLGAVVDLNILQYMIDNKSEYIMELTDKTKADVKGGTIIDYEGTIRLLEIAQVPPQHVEEFKSIEKFKYFNTNNIWLDLSSIKRVLENNELALEIIPNYKIISSDVKGDSDIRVIQLETAIGSAIHYFGNSLGINVPRSRFLPVKTCSDLFLVKSDLYSLQHGQLTMDETRFGGVPLIKLGSHFKKVSDFQKRIPYIPKIIELDHLTMTGAITLGKNVVLKGTVIIVAGDGQSIDIPNGSILENTVVTGNLRLLEH